MISQCHACPDAIWVCGEKLPSKCCSAELVLGVLEFFRRRFSETETFSFAIILLACLLACLQISTAYRTHARTGPDTQRAQAHNHTDTQNSNPRSAPQTNLTFTRTHTPPASLPACLLASNCLLASTDSQSVTHLFHDPAPRPPRSPLRGPRRLWRAAAGPARHRRPMRRLSRRVSRRLRLAPPLPVLL